ncbi:MAG TPA: hypothetical protein PKM63_06230 [Panacibacter sp.]|nr:hypothetical protein [Panacibacter sp.]HNP43864.1 hypothetical protein [Panacibacter sp.]
MKKVLFAILLVSASVSMVAINSDSVYAARSGKNGGSTSIPASQVPTAVKKSFKSMYPTATKLQWEMAPLYYGGNVYTAGFYLGTQKWEANYYADGTFISAAPKI